MPAPLDGVIVLLADGSEARRHQFSVALHEAGAIVITVGTATGALAMLEALRCDVVVTDLELPDHEGDWLLDEVRKRRARLGPLPVIALTTQPPLPHRPDPRFARVLIRRLLPAALIEAIADVRPNERA